MRKALLAALLIAAGGCQDGTAPAAGVTLQAGGVSDVAAADSILRVSGGSTGAEYVLVPFNAATSGESAQLSITGTGTELAADDATGAAAAASRLASAARFAVASPAGAALLPTRDAGFDLALRRRERTVLAPRLGAARAAMVAGTGGARLAVSAALAAEGSTVTLNVNAASACSAPSHRTGRVVAVSDRAVLVEDSANPAGGFTDAEYREIAAAFDSVVYPIDVKNFGTPSDIDANGGRSVILFTSAVNALTPRNSGSYVGGFFYGRDLFPAAQCASSNQAEMFYMLVPDPNGTVNGNVRTKAFVRDMTVGVLGHEFQHLINESRRIYVNDAEDFEDVWLDEGLSHVAEELLFYRASGLAPRSNITASVVRAATVRVDAFNEYVGANFSRLDEYLADPTGNSPYSENDSLATRGATWQFLRYAADQKGGDETATWTALANSRTAGIANLTAVFGTDLLTEVRRWAVAQYADDAVAGAGAVYQQPSWSFRDIFGTVGSGTSGYPLATRALGAGTTIPLTLVPGGAAYVRFRVPANTTARVQVSTVGVRSTAGVPLTLLRTR